MQGVGSQSGLVIDDFTLTKPANWLPSPAARLSVINQGFQSNYTETFIEARCGPYPNCQHSGISKDLLVDPHRGVPSMLSALSYHPAPSEQLW